MKKRTQTIPRNGHLEHLASHFGVAVSTISRALSGKKGISEKLRNEIVEYAKKSGIKPNEHASFLRSGERTGLMLIMPIITTEITAMRNLHLIREAEASFSSVRSVVYQPTDDLDRIVLQAISQRVKAIILSGITQKIGRETLASLAEHGIALTTIDGDCGGGDQIIIKRETGTYQATRLFLLEGRKSPVFYAMASIESPDSRVRGIVDAYASFGKSPESIVLRPVAEATMQEGYLAAKSLLSSMPVDAIFCHSDHMAIGTMKYLLEKGIRIPQDIALIGFDNLPITEYLSVSLTTVAQPVEDAARAAIDLTAKRLVDPASPSLDVPFECRLVMRESAILSDFSKREEIFAPHEN